MLESKMEDRFQRTPTRGRAARLAIGTGKFLRVVFFALLAIFEPLARLSVFLAMLCVASAGLFSVTGPANAPIAELLIGAGVLMTLAALYYVLMRRIRP